MDQLKQPQDEIFPDSRFQKYGIEILEDGSINGPKRPALYTHTPTLKFENSKQRILESENFFFDKHFLYPFSTAEHQATVLEIVDKIFQEITGKSYKEFSNIVIMSEEDFQEYKSLITSRQKQERRIQGDFHGINLGGLIIMQDTGGNNCFPLLFHELGHALYPDENNNYIDELRAMYFQILCTKKLDQELKKIGINSSYPDNYYEGLPLPTEEHRKAFADARALFVYQTQYEMVVKDNPRAEKMMDEFLGIVKQTRESLNENYPD